MAEDFAGADSGRISHVENWLPLSRKLGRYHLCYELAHGGMGKVYLGRVQGPGGFDKLVALKCIHAHLVEDQDFVDMFLDEARIAARITHPHVCTVFDFGCEDGVYFIAMEYLLGETVSKIVRRLAKLETPPERSKVAAFACRIITQAAEGLHVAHELKGDDGRSLGVVHRDVSPQNLFVGYDGNVQVMDFGIAHAAGRLHVTKSGALKGKIAYMSPEQLDRQDLDRRADIWSLGVVLWELLTGRRLFRRRSELDTVVALAKGEILPPSALADGLHPEIDRIVMRALARDPENRFSTARELAVELSRFMNRLNEPVGVPELAQWMEELFHEERARRMELVEQARTGKEPVRKTDVVAEDDVGASQVRIFTGEAEVLQSLAESRPPAQPDGPPKAAAAPPAKPAVAPPTKPVAAPPKPAVAPPTKPVAAPPKPAPPPAKPAATPPRPAPPTPDTAAAPPKPAAMPAKTAAPAEPAPPVVSVPAEVDEPPPEATEITPAPPMEHLAPPANLAPEATEVTPAPALAAETTEVTPAPTARDLAPTASLDESTDLTPRPSPEALAPPSNQKFESWPPRDSAPETPASAPTDAFAPAPLPVEFAPQRSRRTPFVIGGAFLAAAAAGFVIVMATGGDAPETDDTVASAEPADRAPSTETVLEPPAPEPESAAVEPEPDMEESPAMPPRTERARARRTPRRAAAMASMMRPAPMMTAMAPAEPGTVAVVALGGWADVFEGSRRLGRTPARVSLPAGRHRLRLMPFGMAPAVRRTVTVRPGAVTNVAVPVTR